MRGPYLFCTGARHNTNHGARGHRFHARWLVLLPVVRVVRGRRFHTCRFGFGPDRHFGHDLVYIIIGVDGLDERVTQALIAAIVVAAGWVVGFVTSEWRSVSLEQERRRDLIKAAVAEIELIVSYSNEVDWGKAASKTKDEFFKDSRYKIFILYGHEFSTLRRPVDNIEVLRKAQITPVIDAFQLLDRIERMETRLSDPAFAALPANRREAAVLRYIDMQEKVGRTCQKAVDALRKVPFQGLLNMSR